MKLLPLLVALALLFLPSSARAAQENIVLIQADDFSEKLLRTPLRDGKPAMPFLERSLREGALFPNTHNTTPLCAPSRASLLSGQFPHNHGILTNGRRVGGWSGWQNSAILQNNLATDLQEAGYHTAHFGKWTNYYESVDEPLPIPPGWDTWITDSTDLSTRSFYGYKQLVHIPRLGVLREERGPIGNPQYGDGAGLDDPACKISSPKNCHYHSDNISRYALREIREVDAPLYLQLDYHSPHADPAPPAGPQPATRHIGLANEVQPPPDPAWNERNTSDKDFLIQRKNGYLSKKKESFVRSSYRASLEAMRSVDEGIRAISRALLQKGELGNTYFFFVVDNGFFYGEHRFLSGKGLPYRTSATVPTAVWGADVLAQKNLSDISTADLAPTILSLANGKSSRTSDGIDLSSLIWKGKELRNRVVLSERLSPKDEGSLPTILPKPIPLIRPAAKAPNAFYRSIKVGRYRYTDYTQGGEELYDLHQDPYQLYNQSENPAFKKHLLRMREILASYKGCLGRECFGLVRDLPDPVRINSDALPPPRRIGPDEAYLWRDRIYLQKPCKQGCTVSLSLGKETLYRGKALRSFPVARRIDALRGAEFVKKLRVETRRRSSSTSYYLRLRQNSKIEAPPKKMIEKRRGICLLQKSKKYVRVSLSG